MILGLVMTTFLNTLISILNLIQEPIRITFLEQNIIDYVDIIFYNMGLIDLIIPINILKFMLGAMVHLLLIKFTYSIVMWVIHKIPFANIR
jgi:hypothetical protein